MAEKDWTELIIDNASVLALKDCEGLFGIDTLAEQDWTELAIGDANVVVASNVPEEKKKKSFIPVAGLSRFRNIT